MRTVAAGALLTLLLRTAVAQTPQPAQPLDSGLVLRFEVNLVQMDAVVTTHDGRRVPGLKPSAFEVLQDGKPQKITHFSYIAEPPAKPAGPLAGAAGLERTQVQRTIVILADDIFMEFGDFVNLRRALLRFVDEELRPGDLVSVVFTSHGSGALRQFTSDPRLLRRAVERMQWSPPTGVQLAFSTVPFLRELGYTLRDLGGFPGRKSLVLMAPGISAEFRDIRPLADEANRASVTIHTIDARGLPALPPHQHDINGDPLPNGDASTAGVPEPLGVGRLWSSYTASQDTLSLLASATGGVFLHDSNAIFDEIHEAAADSSGYYLIGWYPGAGAFHTNPRRTIDYHRVQIRLRDKSLQVRTRDGYFARTGTPGPRQSFSPAEQMKDALVSPFRSGDLDLALTSSVAQTPGRRDAFEIHTLLHIAAQGVRFEPAANGCIAARLELARALWPVDPNLPPNDRVESEMLDLKACGPTAARVQEDGFIATIADPVPLPGAYQMRVAMRNTYQGEGFSFGPKTLIHRDSSEHNAIPIGSATQFVVVPDLHRTPLALSGITLWSGAAQLPPTAAIAYRPPNPADPAERRFRVGSQLRYSFDIFGSHEEAPTTAMRILHDGQEVAAGLATGTFPLDTLPPGDYVLGISAQTGKLRADQWIDFTVIP